MSTDKYNPIGLKPSDVTIDADKGTASIAGKRFYEAADVNGIDPHTIRKVHKFEKNYQTSAATALTQACAKSGQAKLTCDVEMGSNQHMRGTFYQEKETRVVGTGETMTRHNVIEGFRLQIPTGQMKSAAKFAAEQLNKALEKS